MVPPISPSLSPNFHREFEDVFKLPAMIRRPALEA
jgi:nitric oxide synthase oxygenase domain/subunit